MNLLDLPEEILIQILSYCASDGKQRSLIKTTEVCKYFDDLVGKTSRLMDHIHLFANSKLNRKDKKYKKCALSKRKYSSIKIENEAMNFREPDKEFDLCSGHTKAKIPQSGFDPNYTEFTRKFYEFIPVNFEFKKLAQLTLELDILDYEETILDPLDKWLKTESLANLRKLKLSIETIWENTNHRSTIQSLKASNLNLNEFRLNLPQIVGDDVKLLEEFLQSQRNLVRSELSISSNDIGIMKELSELIGNCGSLKVLSLMIDNSDARLQDYSPPTQTWNLNNVENYEIVLCVNGAVSPVLTAEILQAKGDMTQRLNFTCGDFKLYEFQNITRNFPNLVDLSISHFSRNYSSNVIFVILSNLKKLENLSFVFPLGSKLKSEFFEKFADKLVLPKIKRIAFTFNESIDVENARQLMKAVKNASELKLYSWEFYKREFLYVAIEEMPKLRFIYSGDLEEESESHLDEVEKNVKILVWKHNENPLDFELKIKEYSIKL